MQTVIGTEALSTIAEIAVGLAGFSGIVIVLGRGAGRLTYVERYRLVLLLTPSLASLFVSLIALSLIEPGVPGASRISAALLGAFCVGFPAGLAGPTARLRHHAPGLFNMPLVVALALGYVTVGALELAYAAGVLAPRVPHVLSLGLLYPLLAAGIQFVRMLFVRPRVRKGLGPARTISDGWAVDTGRIRRRALEAAGGGG